MRNIFVWIALLAASLMFTYPEFADAVSNIAQIREISSYADNITGLDETEISQEFEKAEAYNKKIYQEQQIEPFSYRGAAATDKEYDSLLSTGLTGTMCYLEVPKVGLYLGVAHGTKEYNLRYECGHMYGTSLPVGSMGANSVIAGHSGLTSAEIFSHLDRLEEGDVFYIHVLNKVLEYTVRKVYVVLPDDEDPYLQAIHDRDLVTLYTCTPYGVNDHRLIVRAERTGTKDDAGGDGGMQASKLLNRMAMVKAGLLASVPLLVIITGLAMFIRGRRFKKMQVKDIADEKAEEQ